MIDQNLSRWINVLKGVAILEIVMFHFFGDQAKYIASLGPELARAGSAVGNHIEHILFSIPRMGGQGIHVFFFMSGLGIALSELTKTSSPTDFLTKRLSRVYPPYCVAIVFVVALQIVLLGVPFTEDYFVSILSSFFLIRNYSTDWIRTINGDWWFVSAIIPMYLMHLATRQIARERPLAVLGTVFAISFSYKLLIASLLARDIVQFDAGVLNPFTAFFFNYWWEFAAGVAFMNLGGWNRIKNLSSTSCLMLVGMGLAFELAGIWLGETAIGRIFNDDFFVIGQLSTLTGLFLLVNGHRAWSDGALALLAKLGITSYGLYLVHHPISVGLIKLGGGTTWILPAVLLFVVYFLAAWAAGYLVEIIAARGVSAMTRYSAAAKDMPRPNP